MYIAVFCMVLITVLSSESCTYNAQNATYNLQPLTISSQSSRHYHLVHDIDTTRNYSYYFNLCEPVRHMPLDICTNSSKRPEFAQGFCSAFAFSTTVNECPLSNIIPINENAFAYQVNSAQDECYRLSNEDGGPMQWQLYDANDPSAGIVIKLTNGDYSAFCKDASKNREMDLILRCDPETVGMELSAAATIIEDADKSACHYRMELNSLWGCPTQCGIYNNALCNNKGICSYDFSNNIPKCFCFSNFKGDGCQKGTDGKREISETSAMDVTPLTPLFTVNGSEVQYDLNDVYQLNQVIDDFETSNAVTSDYRFYFQFESKITEQELPTSCKTALLSCDLDIDPECVNVTTNNGSVGVAYRVDNSDKSCVLLGEFGRFNTALFDTKLPAKGIRITYEGGYNSRMKVNYQFHIDLECPNMAPESFRNINKLNNTILEVTKYDDVSYAVHFVTPYACPIACRDALISDEIYVCNGRGLCALDPYDKVTKCICDDGYEGDLCERKTLPPKKHNDTVFIVIMVLLLLVIGFVAMIGAMLYRKWKQRAHVAYADLALRHSDLASGLMNVIETEPAKEELPHDINFALCCDTYGYVDPTEVAIMKSS